VQVWGSWRPRHEVKISFVRCGMAQEESCRPLAGCLRAPAPHGNKQRNGTPRGHGHHAAIESRHCARLWAMCPAWIICVQASASGKNKKDLACRPRQDIFVDNVCPS